MEKFEFSLELKGADKLLKILRPELFDGLMRRHVSRATQQNSLFVVAEMRKTIQKGNLEKNAPLTQAIKGSDKPLVDNADLFKAITHKKVDAFEAFAGVLRTDTRYNIGATLHEGISINVTPKMRNMFRALWFVSIGSMDSSGLKGAAAELWKKRPGGWLPLAASTQKIVIPKRPFVTITVNNQTLKVRVENNWKKALGFVFRDMRRNFFT